MSWRTVVITQRCKLDLMMNYLEIRGEETRKIHLSEIHTLIIESTAVSLTAALLCELIQQKIKVIFCDRKRNPLSELLPYYGSYESSAKIRQQISWDMETKGLIWSEIVSEKIHRQQELLIKIEQNDRAKLLEKYIDNIEEADSTNREGHAAKVYFGGIFGKDFSRAQDSPINAALNYGYSILLSSFNKEIVSAGYLTQIGIFHDNMFNPYNLASDLMEPFRPLIDEIVLRLRPEEFDKKMRYELIGVLNQQVEIDNQVQYVSNAIRIFTRSVLSAMNEKSPAELRFYHNINHAKGENKKAHEKQEDEKEPELLRKVNDVLRRLEKED